MGKIAVLSIMIVQDFITTSQDFITNGKDFITTGKNL